jgi:type I site-specific restriction-modification system R (restriction) subunit
MEEIEQKKLSEWLSFLMNTIKEEERLIFIKMINSKKYLEASKLLAKVIQTRIESKDIDEKELQKYIEEANKLENKSLQTKTKTQQKQEEMKQEEPKQETIQRPTFTAEDLNFYR